VEDRAASSFSRAFWRIRRCVSPRAGHRLHGEGIALSGILESAGGSAAVAARGIALAAVIVVTGALVFRRLVLGRAPEGRPAAARMLESLAATAGASAAATLVLIAPLRLLLQARMLVSPGDPVSPMAWAVVGTTWGKGLTLQLACAALALAGFVLARRGNPRGWTLALASALLLALSPAMMGHAVAPEHGLAWSVLTDWVHVLSAGGWTGALSLIAAASLALRRTRDGGATLASIIERFHRVALVSAAMLLLSGTVSLLYRVEHLRDLLTSSYGALFFTKLALVGLVAAFGAYHSRAGAAKARVSGAQDVARSLLAETVLAALTIAVTAVLVGSEPPTAT